MHVLGLGHYSRGAHGLAILIVHPSHTRLYETNNIGHMA